MARYMNRRMALVRYPPYAGTSLEGEHKMEKIEWDLYTATEAEIQALWRLVQQAFELFDPTQSNIKDEAMEVA
jgi:hypothetical protein